MLFNLDENQRIVDDVFYSYNLDDIVRNGRTISSFLRETFNIGRDVPDKRMAKRRLDEAYADAIMPPIGSSDASTEFSYEFNLLEKRGFVNNDYYFISYSSKDYRCVTNLRDMIEKAGIRCWMAPRDNPHGSNYAHVIELAVKNASRFILMLSESSVWSVWVEKELLRAIHYLQHSASDRLLAVWIGSPVALDNTPMAYPLEGVQMVGRISSVREYTKLLPEETAHRLTLIEKLEKAKSVFEDSLITESYIRNRFEKTLAISCAVLRHFEEASDQGLCEAGQRLTQFNDELRSSLRLMKMAGTPEDE